MKQENKITKEDLSEAMDFMLDKDTTADDIEVLSNVLFESGYVVDLSKIGLAAGMSLAQSSLIFTLIMLSIHSRDVRIGDKKRKKITDHWLFWFAIGGLIAILWALIVVLFGG